MALPQIKHDLNRSGWETTDFPSVCENCLPENPYVTMTKEDRGAQCKICTRPYTLFEWRKDRKAQRKSQTNICLTCARLKNSCQCCMLDLSFGLPINVRDAALKMVAPGPTSSINREYYAQNHEKEIEEGRGAIEEYEKTDEKAIEVLRRLASSDQFNRGRKAQLAIEGIEENNGEGSSDEPRTHSQYGNGPGPIRTSQSRLGNSLPGRGGAAGRGARGGFGGRGARAGPYVPPTAEELAPPADPNIATLFLTGVYDGLPEHELRVFFTQFGQLRSVVCSHRAHAAYINFMSRESAEAAAKHCQGKAVVKDFPLRVTWAKAKPKPLDSLTPEERAQNRSRESRQGKRSQSDNGGQSEKKALTAAGETGQESTKGYSVAPPPGSSSVQYASMSGE
ncbi:pre-mRNA-splicing factor s.t1.c11 [Penicillium taxi]|uniref:pre-mRNA-splicing factor s.t1.c11 n=1 Tax=Penicillium taxi TaxID=168475 RepID=UPI002544D80E|nr:pre-mRNA-splicing factor s.t1.c11 [Penicillium taxi]KAJ5885387.1 pre-mRNA-splicing factor s.t1.c11 [Penicillium taxi]